ncbi:methyltransferase domain-containing protein [Candidatus Hecatella orcuttiae]|jgi:hypothetical protein|uniref:methyltransferase domain-containing protein n=1 Tax=Candidatus Hecatella orcuttiae TaxID=1935119 RepID=UPI002867E179|nr:methyltransferase domain-containing protein [Candidatus Hecatella orcuttiae]
MVTLDVGCGRNKRKDIGVDIDPIVNPDVGADMHYLPFQEKCFEQVYLFHTFEHSDKPHTLLRELTRISRRYITIITIVVPNLIAIPYYFLLPRLAGRKTVSNPLYDAGGETIP